MATRTVFEIPDGPAIVLQFPRSLHLRDDDKLFAFCQVNGDVRIERSADGEIHIRPPVGGETGTLELHLGTQLAVWAEHDGTGVAFGSNTGFTLPNRAMRSPDASWVRMDRLKRLTPAQKKKFLPLCPDFVVEIRSPSDRLPELQRKMQEYLDNGAQLGWLIDPISQHLYVYQQGRPMQKLRKPATVSGEPLLPGFVLKLKRFWGPVF